MLNHNNYKNTQRTFILIELHLLNCKGYDVVMFFTVQKCGGSVCFNELLEKLNFDDNTIDDDVDVTLISHQKV